jgi:hypothetical protein
MDQKGFQNVHHLDGCMRLALQLSDRKSSHGEDIDETGGGMETMAYGEDTKQYESNTL